MNDCIDDSRDDPYVAPTSANAADEEKSLDQSWPHRLTVSILLTALGTFLLIVPSVQPYRNQELFLLQFVACAVPIIVVAAWLAISALRHRRLQAVRVVSIALLVLLSLLLLPIIPLLIF